MPFDPRQLQPSTDLHVIGARFKAIRMDVLEGHASAGEVQLKPMMVGRDILLVEIAEKAGVQVPTHSHDDHESVVYLISGFRWSFFGTADVSIGVSLGMTLVFLVGCLLTVRWIFKTGYRLKQ